jgi:hypothetical protein
VQSFFNGIHGDQAIFREKLSTHSLGPLTEAGLCEEFFNELACSGGRQARLGLFRVKVLTS